MLGAGPGPDPAGARHRGAEFGRLRRPGRGDIRGDLLPLHRRLVRRRDLRHDLLQPPARRRCGPAWAGRGCRWLQHRLGPGQSDAAAEAAAPPGSRWWMPMPSRIDKIFLVRGAAGAAAFVLSCFLREARSQDGGRRGPRRGHRAGSAERTSVQEIERSLLRLADGDMRRQGYERIAELAGTDVPGGRAGSWRGWPSTVTSPASHWPGRPASPSSTDGPTWTSWSSAAWSGATAPCCG